MVLWILLASRSWRCNYILPSKLGETDRSRGRWLVVSTEQLFLKIGTPDSAALFYTRTTSLNWDNAKYSDFETSWQNFPNGDKMEKSPKESWQVFEQLFHLSLCMNTTSKYVSDIAKRRHIESSLSLQLIRWREGESIRDDGKKSIPGHATYKAALMDKHGFLNSH